MPVLDQPINVELGNHDAVGNTSSSPVVSYFQIPAGLDFDPSITSADLRAELERAMRQPEPKRGITNLPGSQALLGLTHPNGHWPRHSNQGLAGATPPAWVWSDNPAFSKAVSDYHQVPADRPQGYEELYWRQAGTSTLAPGVVAGTVSPKALLMNTGVNVWAYALGGGQVSVTGTASSGTAPTTTTLLTGNTLTCSANQFAGYRLYAAITGGMVYGNITANTSGGPAAITFTVDQWYAIPEVTAGTAGTTPSTSAQYLVASGGAPAAWYMGLSTDSTYANSAGSGGPVYTDTSLRSEATTNGMQRQKASFGYTTPTSTGATLRISTFTLQGVFTFTGSGATNFYAMGLNTGIKTAASVMVFETAFATFQVSQNGDTATVTDTVYGS